MKPCSDQFRIAVRESNDIAVKASVLRVGQDPTDVSLMSGTVTLDAKAASLGRMDVTTVDDGTLGLVPTDAGSLLAPYGNELRIWRGIVHSDGEPELMSLGIFGIEVTGVDETPTGRAIGLSGLDRSGRVVEARFEAPHYIAAGTNVETAIVNTILPIMPGLETRFPGALFVTPLLVAEEGADRWKFCQDIATACGLILYFDGDGILRLEPLLGGLPVAEFVEGPGGLLLSAKRDWRREGSYNVAIVTGENTGLAAPVRAVAMDLNPASPTYARGPFGRVPVFLDSQLVTTQPQAQAAANALLIRQLGTTQTVTFDGYADPSLEPGDSVQITRLAAGIDEVHTIDQITISLDPATAMSAQTRAMQVGVIDEVQADIDHMAELGAADRASSLLRATAINDASVGTQFLEDWPNLTQWSGAAGAQQVSTGRLFSNGAGLASGLVHTYPILDTQQLRATIQVRTIGGHGGSLIIGVSADATGVAPTPAAAKARGLLFDTLGRISKWDQGVATVLLTGLTGTQDWIVTISTDRQAIYFMARNTVTGAIVITACWRYGVPINNLFVYNPDARLLSGSSTGELSARAALATVIPANRVSEPTTEFAILDNGKVLAQAQFPANYDSTVATPVIIGFHGLGGSVSTFNQLPVVNKLVDAGYIFLTSSYGATWGAPRGVSSMLMAYWWLRDRYPVGPLVLFGISMGGIVSLIMLAESQLPGVVGWSGLSPAIDLDWMYANGHSATINAAYGVTTQAAFEAATVNRDPMDMDPRLFRSVPMQFLANTDDVSVPRTIHSEPLYTKVDPYCDATIITGTGGHATWPASWDDDIVAFADDCVTA